MTPPPHPGLREPVPATAGATHGGATLRRGPAPRSVRRRSRPARHRGGAVAAPAPFALRLGRTAMRVGDARVLDRLVRGRGWIALIAVGLMGIVFMQVSLLKLNAGISRAVTTADTLERQNATLRAQISSLDSGERIQDVAARLGMVMPPAGEVRFLDARGTSATRAANSIHLPDPVTLLAGATPTAPAATAPVTTTAPTASTTTTPPPVTASPTPSATTTPGG
jgi:cell division protein FtsL